VYADFVTRDDGAVLVLWLVSQAEKTEVSNCKLLFARCLTNKPRRRVGGPRDRKDAAL
jgi:hypothetical protein